MTLTPAEHAAWHRALVIDRLERTGFGPEAAAELYDLAARHAETFGGFAAALDAFRGIR